MSDNEDLASIDSYEVKNGDALNPQSYAPEAFTVERTNTQSTANRSLKLVRTETAKSLADMGMQSEAPIPDVVNPTMIETPIFPEEYTMETETGLVPVATLQELGRTGTNLSRTRSNRYLTRHSTRVSDEDEKPDQMPEYDPEIEFVTFVIGDPENPHNWNIYKRCFFVFLYALTVVSVAYGSACVTGGLSLICDKYNVSLEVAILTCSLVVIGFLLGSPVFGPLSELIGRRYTYIISLSLATIFNIPCALAKNIGTLLVCRFLTGFFSSSGLSLAAASISDMFPKETRGYAIAIFAWTPYSGAVFGPLVNGFVSVSTEKESLFHWINMAFTGAMFLIMAALPETYAPIILKNRAAKLRKETGNPKIMTEQEARKMTLKELIQANLVRPLYFAATEPVLDLTCFYICLIYALLYGFFFAYPVIFSELYGYGDNLIGLMMIPILIGATLALCVTPYCEGKYLALCKVRAPTPEDRLLGAMIGAPFPALALWILGATSYKHIIWVGPASAGIPFGFGMVLIYYSLNNYIIDSYALYASSALSTKVFLRSAGGAAFPLFTIQMYHKLGLQWASWLLAFIATAMIAVPYAFYFYGKTLRAKLSKNDYSNAP